jgi:hypothetical protein
MKTLLFAMLLLAAASLHAQSSYYNRVFEARYMGKPPVFPPGADSLKRFYFTHFPAFDTMISKAVANGDTAKFIRIYFSFNLDESGFVYDPQFEKVASTRSAVTESAKTIRYFTDMKAVLQKAVKEMLHQMPQWRPGVQDGQPVKTLNYDYLQFWVGLTAPTQ